ncbi:hypothetical protein AVEN_235521-1 [Araneus ventricosus]|uniref:Parvovirus non-structural protein 1 helicase domain-containing protein n=1 Tax=Araneus ventricosus TaxID=182803 RepID=A0A4Y2A500_ARAVE|nr:hypothetical protein AVEN_235521-1 [Araneus ventricosus]
MFSYRKIVFGIKHKYQLGDVLKIFKQQRCYSILISQHNAIDTDDCCDRLDEHYHGVVEFSNGEGKIGNFLMQLWPYCMYINDDHCSSPAEYLAYITLAPKRTVAQAILNSSKLLDYLQTASSMKLEVLRRKTERKISLIERNAKVIKLVDILLKSGYEGNCGLSQFKKNEEQFQKWLNEINETARSISQETIETALSVSQKIVLNSPILVLSNRFELQNGYLSPEESVRFVLDWCSYQKLNPKEFTRNLIRCLDKEGGNRNSIYLQGSGNSGKTYIIQSILDACIHVGQVMVESTAYPYVWEKCVDKRLIVLREPHFSTINFDQLDKILSGSGTLIFKHNDIVDYLPPTPVIILANEHDWTDDPQLSEKIKKRFLCCYMGLKSSPNMSEKKLHPRWLSLLNETFSCQNSSKADQMGSKTSFARPLKFNPDTNNGMKLTEERLNGGGEKASSHSLKTSGDCDLFTTQISTNTKQGSENTMQPNPKYRKRPMRDIGHDGGRNKMNRVDVI